jgi:uncharacterized protein (TIGR02453 family)
MDAPFLGFPQTQAFLRNLRANNERAWFTAHKAAYETAYRAPAEAFAAELCPRLEALAEAPVSAKVFRIHRDVRFSKDKSPYNTHLHIGFQAERRPGEPRRRGGFYFGIDPDRVTLGVGAFGFGPVDLERYRRAVASDFEGAELAEMIQRLGVRMHPTDLKRVPAPYAADHPRGELLRRKGLSVWRDLDDPTVVADPNLPDLALAHFEALDPVNVWLTEVLEG